MATTIGGYSPYGGYNAQPPSGMTEAQLAAQNLAESNRVNALKVGSTITSAYGGDTAPAGGNPYLQGGGNSGGAPAAPQAPWGQSPWVDRTAQALTNQSRQNLFQNVMPGIRSGAQSAGQYGGSRQAIAEGVAAGNAQTGLDSALASLYGNAYGQDQSASLQNKSLDNSYNLGLGNLSLTNQGQMQNFYTNQRGQDLNQAQLGANIYGAGNQGNLGIGQGQYNLGKTSMNAPADAISQYNSLISPYTGFGQSNTTTGTSGGGAQGVIGGALAGGQIASNLGFGNNWGTGNKYGNQDYGLFI